MNKRISLFVLAMCTLFLYTTKVFAQETSDNPALWAHIEKELAGDPAGHGGWHFRTTKNGQSGLFQLSRFTPENVITQENANRSNTSEELNTSPSDEPGQTQIYRNREMLNPKSWKGSFYRYMAGAGDFFDEPYILPTDKTTELQKIRDIYLRITGTVTQYGVPPGGESASNCLKSGIGKCRHMATILHDSLEQADVTSEMMFSPTHTWVRVTLSDPAYAGIVFDLDPTWYQEPIPLPPRSQSPISKQWQDRMLAITVLPEGLDLNGTWTGESSDDVIAITHTGNDITSVVVQGYPGWIGKVTFLGQITGLSIEGKQLWRGQSHCPDFSMFRDASGSVSEDGKALTVSSISPEIYISDCTFAYDGAEETRTYIKQEGN